MKLGYCAVEISIHILHRIECDSAIRQIQSLMPLLLLRSKVRILKVRGHVTRIHT